MPWVSGLIRNTPPRPTISSRVVSESLHRQQRLLISIIQRSVDNNTLLDRIGGHFRR